MTMHNPDSCQDYYEAWKVKDGVVEAQEDFFGKKLPYDDQWLPDTVGGVVTKKAVFDSEVYWIPAGTEAYEEIDAWPRFKGGRLKDTESFDEEKNYGVPYAGTLKSSWTIDTDISEYFVFDRHYEWKAGLKL